MSAVHFDQLIVNAAVSRGVTSNPLYTLWAKILIIWNQVVTQTYNSAKNHIFVYRVLN